VGAIGMKTWSPLPLSINPNGSLLDNRKTKSALTAVAQAQTLPEIQSSTQNELEIAPSIPRHQSKIVVPKSRTSDRAGRSGTISFENPNQALGSGASDYLHRHRLPYVDAKVFDDENGQPRIVTLSGKVRTEFGKQDAERKVQTFLERSALVIRNQVEIVPELASAEPFQSSRQTAELNLPEGFFGCWQGTSIRSDTEQYLGGCPPGYEVPETTTWCFRKTGGGSFEMTRQSATAPLQNFREHTELTGSDGRTHADLNSVGSYNIPVSMVTYALVTYTDVSHCEMVSNGGVLACEGPAVYDCDARPWYRKSGHIDMYRVSP
jgi:hypothetical protein